MKQGARHVIFPLAIFFFALFYGYLTSQLKESAFSTAGKTLGPNFMPYLLTIAVIIISVMEAIVNYLKMKRNELDSSGKDFAFSKTLLNLAVIVLFILFIVLMPKIGFLPLSIFFVAGMLIIAGIRSPLKIIGIPMLVGGVFHLIFTTLLHVPLP